MMRTPLRQIAHAVWAWVPVKAPTWHGTEQLIVSEESQLLDVDIISTAYNTAMNPGLLATAAICLSGLDPSLHVVDCIERLQKIDENHFGVFPSPYICSVVSATGGPVLYDLWADSLLCSSLEEVKEIALRRRTNRVTALAAQIYEHFGATKPTLSAPEQETVVRTVLGLSMAICHGACTTRIRTWHNVLHSFQQILTNCSLGELSSMNVRSAAAAAHQVLEGPPPDFEDLRLFCTYFTAANIMLECVLASHDVAPDHHRAILSYANHVLLHLTDTLQEVADAGEDLLPRCDQYWLNFFVENLSDLVNIVTEEPAFPVRALFPADRIVALERAFVAVQHLIVHTGLVEVESRIGNRAGYRETCEDKLVRLRALRSRSESPQQETTPPGINLATTWPSAPVPGEPPATSAPVERPPSPSIETAAPDSVEPVSVGGDKGSTSIPTLDPSSHATVPVERPGLPTPQPSSHYSIPNRELYASPGSMHAGVISTPVLVDPSIASVPVELSGSMPAAPPTPVPASELPASVSEERPTNPRSSSHHSMSAEPHMSPRTSLHGGVSDGGHEPSL
ncbi:uncharacterized protein TRAVEDRAFT_66616 [Trametes versicolor FP-101664 SS1]|uniref:uncharacterized protein n=1 Tax=Trametes versicolor (strain FP-101664) TaxID=717944 RepID=UPI000462289F|nr:uncharacterized protein TRAVEDRAFT_66616 [Trametes versicolor FP-101664 SS1]EIW53894.1 hypothetical protein TRAVEDRAFT_66616 [Trametes versicolor FP-101664 SS1]